MRAILTGHSRGLGAALCESLLRRGVRVLGLSRGGNRALAARFGALLGEQQVDLGDPATLDALAESPWLADFLAGAEPAMLINNAGLLQPVGPVGGQGAEALAGAVRVNVMAPLVLSDAFVRLTTACGDRRILHVSSGAARTPYAGWSIYCACKAALDHHARATQEDRIAGLRIASLAPGVIDTDMQADIRTITADRFPQVERFRALKQTGALRPPEEAAEAVCGYLLADGFGTQAVADLRDT